jgi:hypothetical protein
MAGEPANMHRCRGTRSECVEGMVMKRTVALLVLLALVAITAGALALAGGTDTADVALCHKGSVSILVDENSVSAHLRHGDTLGPCP